LGLTETKLKFFADFIEKQLGIVYEPHVYFQLELRLEKIAQYLGLATTDDVYSKAAFEGITGDFKEYLLDIATNNETSFFRDPKVFAAIESKILPSLKSEFPGAFSYRVWCAASSFGQEPYSMAMLAHELVKKTPGHPRIEIIASDISDQALTRARAARYSQLEIQRGLPATRLIQCFAKEGEANWVLKPEVRSLVDFRRQNLLDPVTSIGMCHIIMCRYVLIYQDSERKKAIIQKLIKNLHPRGYLILGASESALGLSDELTQVALDGAIGYHRKD